MRPYRLATRYALAEQAGNRFALTLVAAFVPLWVALMDWVVPHTAVAFHYRAGDRTLGVDGQHLSLLTGALNAVTLIVGFMMFSAARRCAPFERRLIHCGFPARSLLAAKLTMLTVVAFLTTAYTTALVRMFWTPEQLLPLGLSLLAAAFAYGGLGILVAVALPGQLEGMFVIVMTSLVDTTIQNPMGNPAADKSVLRYFPAYGPMQSAVGAGFTRHTPWPYTALAAAWLAGTALVGLTVLHLRTRSRYPMAPAPAQARSVPEATARAQR